MPHSRLRNLFRIEEDGHASNVRRDVLEYLQFFALHRELGRSEAGDVAARMRQAGDKPGADRIADLSKDNWYPTGLLLQRLQYQRADGQDYVRLQANKLDRIGPNALAVSGAPAIVDVHVAAVCPTQLLKRMLEHRDICLRI